MNRRGYGFHWTACNSRRRGGAPAGIAVLVLIIAAVIARPVQHAASAAWHLLTQVLVITVWLAGGLAAVAALACACFLVIRVAGWQLARRRSQAAGRHEADVLDARALARPAAITHPPARAAARRAPALRRPGRGPAAATTPPRPADPGPATAPGAPAGRPPRPRPPPPERPQLPRPPDHRATTRPPGHGHRKGWTP